MKSKGLEKNTEVWTTSLYYDFRAFDNSSDHWEIRGRSNRTTFFAWCNNRTIVFKVFLGCVTIELLSRK
ncbi:hypothetical protein [Peptostreptococcus sp. D1]|uniref:hypothetical protein n=1 Tax=Peptostreptococcus sp. D1 TaxID=72304 RepID=UPI001160153E|nr:hypothetical protein [Peptostreptococcus sp. D1]